MRLDYHMLLISSPLNVLARSAPGRYSIHINKNSSIGLKNVFTVWCCNNRRRSPCKTKLWRSQRLPMLVMLHASWYFFVTYIKVVRPLI